MKKLILLIAICSSGCSKDEGGFSCSSVPAGLSSAAVNDSIMSAELYATFSSVTPSVFVSGPFCSETYDFNQYNENSGGWCYYYQVDVDCSTKLITSIYSGT